MQRYGEQSMLIENSNVGFDSTDNVPHRKNYFVGKAKVYGKGIVLCVAFMWIDISFSIIGPAFLDLCLITNSDIQTASIIMSAGSVGYILGDVTAGLTLEKISSWLSTVLGSLVAIVTIILIPLCSTVPLMAATQLANWMSNGLVDTTVHTLCVEIYGSAVGPIIQMLHFSYSVGGTFAPLIVEPFLAQTSNESITPEAKPPNEPHFPTQNMSRFIDWKTEDSSSTRIKIAYLIVGGITLASLVLFLVVFRKHRGTIHTGNEDTKNLPASPKTLRGKLCVLALVAGFFVLNTGMETTFAEFLATYVVRALHWTKSDAAVLTSVYWAAMSVGRFSSIFLTALVRSWTLLAANVVLTTVSMVIFLIGAETRTVVWLSSFLVGLGMSSMYPSGLTWVNESITPLSSRMVSFLNAFGSVGICVSPMLLGYLFENYSPSWFLYFTLGGAVLSLADFILINLVQRYCVSTKPSYIKEIIID